MSDYRTTTRILARMVSELAATLEDQILKAQKKDDHDDNDLAHRYAAALTKHGDRPVYLPTVEEDDDPAPKPTYAIPNPPPLEYRVVDRTGQKWTHLKDAPGWFDRDDSGRREEWVDLLDAFGPVTLDEWTDEERASFELYGPPGARWGNPAQPCSHYACSLGWGHTGLHINDVTGEPIEPPPADGTTVDAGITPHESSETPCTCGHPDRHRPGCPRYARTAGLTTAGVTDDPDAPF